ncbi:MAG: hypothetical protein ACRDU5_12530 [Mycobacterium sp.]
MRKAIRYLTPLLAVAVVCLSVLAAPVAAAAPECTNTGPTTTQCESNGSTQIVTSPPATNYYPYWGFPIIGFDGIGIGW